MSSAGQFKHIIICNPKTAADGKQLLVVANEFAKIPKVTDVAAGRLTGRDGISLIQNDGDTRPVVLLITTDNRNDYIEVKSDASYQNLLNNTVPSLVSNDKDSIRIMNTELENYVVSESFIQQTTAADLQRRTAAVKQLEEQRSRTK